MDTNIDEVEDVLAAHPRMVIDALAKLYAETPIVATIVTSDRGPFRGKIVEITKATISILANGEDEEPIVIHRNDIREIFHDFARIGRRVQP